MIDNNINKQNKILQDILNKPGDYFNFDKYLKEGPIKNVGSLYMYKEKIKIFISVERKELLVKFEHLYRHNNTCNFYLDYVHFTDIKFDKIDLYDFIENPNCEKIKDYLNSISKILIKKNIARKEQLLLKENKNPVSNLKVFRFEATNHQIIQSMFLERKADIETDLICSNMPNFLNSIIKNKDFYNLYVNKIPILLESLNSYNKVEIYKIMFIYKLELLKILKHLNLDVNGHYRIKDLLFYWEKHILEIFTIKELLELSLKQDEKDLELYQNLILTI